MMGQTGGPTILGVDVLWVATILSGIAAFAVMVALYAATTARDPMTKRVKALNDRREQLKAGITALHQAARPAGPAQRRRRPDAHHPVVDEGVQDSQLKAAQIKLLQAGIRKKEWAVAVIFGRLVLPILIGGFMTIWVYGTDGFAEWSPLKKYALVAVSLIASYKAPDIFLKNKITKRSHAIRKGLPDALDLLVICAEAGLTVDAAFHRVARELGRAYPELGEEFTLTGSSWASSATGVRRSRIWRCASIWTR